MSIKIDIKILLFIAIFYITKQLETYLLFMFFIILHEVVHLLAGVVVGAKPQSFEINHIGCSISFRYKLDDYNKKILNGNFVELKKIFIYISGPLFNLLVGIIALFVNSNINIVYVNLVICLINIMCIYPIDGGRIIKSILHILLGEKKAYELMLKISNIFFILLLMFSSVVILKYHNIGIIIGLLCIALIKIKYSKEIRIKLRIINLIG